MSTGFLYGSLSAEPRTGMHAFAFVASLNIYCTSRRVILRTFPRFVFVCFVLKTGLYTRTF